MAEIIRDGDIRCDGAAGVDKRRAADCDGRGGHGSRRNREIDRCFTFVVIIADDGKTVLADICPVRIDIDVIVILAIYQRYAVQNNTFQLGAFLCSVVHDAVTLQRNHSARDILAVDLDGHDAGRSCVFRRVRRECPFGSIAACDGLDRAVLPRECARDLRAGGRILHLARDGAVVQRLTVGDAACAHFAVRHRDSLIHRADIDGQGDIRIVCRGNCNGDRAELSFVRAASVHNFQRQRTGLAVYKGDKRANTQIGNRLAIADRTVLAGSGQTRQQRREVEGIGLMQAVCDGQRAILRRGCGGLGDGDDRAAVIPASPLIRGVEIGVVQHIVIVC